MSRNADLDDLKDQNYKKAVAADWKEIRDMEETKTQTTDDGDFICLNCGPATGERHYTKINGAGPLCDKCIELGQAEEDSENSQFGVGA